MNKWYPLAILTLSLLVAAMDGCSFPKRDLEKEEVATVTSRKELMWFLHTISSNGLKIAIDTDPADLGEEDFRILAEMARRTPWAADRLAEPRFSMGEQFNTLAAKLATRADILYGAARLRDGNRTRKAAMDLDLTCQECHQRYRD